ncbi:MAG: ABC-F family ATP-binding cassette domain-containing protein [Lachnospiraceae bacterium]|nr:ABC-F family ATP-binding cassette domain-containing protein [Lachnospiraceae bacterium]
MNILECHNLSKEFNDVPIFRDVSFRMEEKEKAAIVGINGAGKTTFLRVLLGELEPEEGMVVFAKDLRIGYLAQNQNLDSSNTIREELLLVKQDLLDAESRLRALEEEMGRLYGDELLSAVEEHDRLNDLFSRENGFGIRGEVVGVARGLGFSDEELDKRISTLSGGQKTRVALGRLLLQKNDLIILDEPTNHLDMHAIEWLENYLRNYTGAVLIVSHDRYFLDRIVTKVAELDATRLTVWNGNYSAYAEKRAKARADQLHAWMNQQREIRHQEEVIARLKSYNREKSIKRAESREKMLSKIEVLDKPTQTRDDMHLTLTPSVESGGDVLKVEHLAKSFPENPLFSDLSFEIKRGEHVAIVGDNGTGKTTLLKIINNLLPADRGSVTTGVRVKIAYYDQEHHVLHDGNTLFDEISDAHPDMNNTEIRTRLAAFLFTGDDVFKQVGNLSGGEKGRLSLLKLMLSKANFLLLDEPTNHLDITSKEILEEAIRGYTGTVLYVSHDRYFINRTATRILELTRRQLVNYIGDYDYYAAHREERMNRLDAPGFPGMQSLDEEAVPASSSKDNKADWQAQKEQQKEQRRRENELKKCEEEIARLEERVRAIDEELSLPEVGTDLARLRKLSDEQAEINARLKDLYEEWERLA